MRTGGVLLLVYIVVGVVVAAINNYFQGLGNLTDVLELLAAIFLWPAVLLGVDINFAGGGGNGGGGGGNRGGGGGGGG
jgi:hypothetical protein